MDEDIAIPLIIFSFFFAMTWMILNYRKWRFEQKQETERSVRNSLGTSELKDLMRQAVIEANTPLLERIETLETELRQAKAPRLPAAQRDPMVEERHQTREAVPAKRRVSPQSRYDKGVGSTTGSLRCEFSTVPPRSHVQRWLRLPCTCSTRKASTLVRCALFNG